MWDVVCLVYLFWNGYRGTFLTGYPSFPRVTLWVGFQDDTEAQASMSASREVGLFGLIGMKIFPSPLELDQWLCSICYKSSPHSTNEIVQELVELRL